MKPSIEVKNLTLQYPESQTPALEGVTFSLAAGRIYGLLGRNGSGKTSLLSVLAAFRKTTAGTAQLDGAPIFENPKATRQICLIRGPGDTVAHDWPEDRADDALRTAGMFRPYWDPDYADELVDKFQLPLRKRLGQLSQGDRSQLGVVLGLASRAPVTIFDESHLGMDAPSRHLFYDELLQDYAAHPRTFILSSHLIDEVGPLLEEILIMHQGRLLLHEEVEALRGRGATVTGPVARVDAFTKGLQVMAEKQLGPTKQATVYEPRDGQFPEKAQAYGLEPGPVTLQDLFIHLTKPGDGDPADDERPDRHDAGTPASTAPVGSAAPTGQDGDTR